MATLLALAVSGCGGAGVDADGSPALDGAAASDAAGGDGASAADAPAAGDAAAEDGAPPAVDAEAIVPGAYYVATTGDDENPGTAEAPWRTIQKAASTATAGDTVYIRAGTYREQVTVMNSGTAGAYIRFSSYPGETVTVDGTDVLMGYFEPLFGVGQQSYIEIRGIAVTNSPGQGFGDANPEADNGFIVIKDCSTYRTQISGVHFYNAHDVVVDGVYIDTPNLTRDQEAISFHGVHTFEIKNCTLIHQQKEGFDVKVGSSDGKIFNNTIMEPNLAYEYSVAVYVDAWDSSCTDLEIYDNTLIGCQTAFIVGGELGGATTNVNMHDNTVDGCAIGFVLDSYGSPVLDGITVDHNTLSGITSIGIALLNASATNTRVTYNTVTGIGSYTPFYAEDGALANTHVEGNSFTP